MLLWFDDFSHDRLNAIGNIGEVYEAGAAQLKYTGGAGGYDPGTDGIRPGDQFAIVSNGGLKGLITRDLAPIGTDFIVGFGFRHTRTVSAGGGDANAFIFQAIEGSTIQCGVTIDANLKLQLWRGGPFANTAIGSPSTKTIEPNTWYWIEVKGTIHDSTGALEVKVDKTVAVSATNVDTRYGGTGAWNRVFIGFGPAATGRISEGFYVCDNDNSDSAGKNTYLGVCYTRRHVAKTDAAGGGGAHSDFTLNTGTDHGANLDDLPGDGNTTYGASSTTGDRESVQLTPPLSLGGHAIHAVAVWPYLQKTDAGARVAGAGIRTGGADFDHPTLIDPATDYQWHPRIFALNPDTSAAWTEAAVNAAEAQTFVDS